MKAAQPSPPSSYSISMKNEYAILCQSLAKFILTFRCISARVPPEQLLRDPLTQSNSFFALPPHLAYRTICEKMNRRKFSWIALAASRSSARLSRRRHRRHLRCVTHRRFATRKSVRQRRKQNGAPMGAPPLEDGERPGAH